jgi:transposase-like protein
LEEQKLPEEDRMNVHKNARLTPRGREILISRLERGARPLDVATAMGVSASTVYKWWRRYRAEGPAGLLDRSSRPNASPNRTPDDVEAKVIALRKERRIYHRIAAEVGVSRATVGRILTRHGLNR